MPDRGVVDIALLEVGLASGNVRLREVKDFTIDDSDPGAEVVKTMTPEREPIGHKGGITDVEISMTVMPTREPEVNWLGLRKSKEIFKIFYEENLGGNRFRVTGCRVVEAGKSFNADGEAELTLKILAFTHDPEE